MKFIIIIMSGIPKKEIKKHIPVKDLDNRIKKLEKDVKVLNRLHIIKACYSGMSIKEAAELNGVSYSNAYVWFNRWNEEGPEGIIPKYAEGRPSYLTSDEKIELEKILEQEEVITTESVHKIIKENFGVDYTHKQVRIIVKSLGYSYSKPYSINIETDPQKVEIFKKKLSQFNLDDYIIGFLDQTSCQDSANSPKTLNKKGRKNRIKKRGKKFKQTAMGFQAVNGNSIVNFPENSRTPNMIKFAGEIRCNNLKNKNLIPLIENALNHENLDDENIKKELDKELLTKEQLTMNIINRLDDNKISNKEYLMKSINRDFNKANKDDKKKIQDYKIQQMVDNLEKINLKPLIKEEKPIVIVLDNYTPHRNAIFQKACKLLNIILVRLPPYSPQLNPIEQVWKSIKRITYTTLVETKEELIELFKKEYYKIVDNESFFNKWISKYILKS